VEGVAEPVAQHAREASGLQAGVILRDFDVTTAFDRIGAASAGALEPAEEEAWSVAPSPEGAHLTLRVTSRPAQVHLSLAQPDGVPLYNRIDGIAPWLGVDALIHDRVAYNHLGLYARASYGFASHDPRFVAGARRGFGAGGWLNLGYEFHDLTDSDDLFRGSALQETLRTLLFRSSFRDYYRRRGHEAYVFSRLSPRAHVGLNWRSDRYESVVSHADGSLFHKSEPARPNSEVQPGLMRSLVATLRWSSQEPLVGGPAAEHESFLVRSLYGLNAEPLAGVRVEGSFEWASPRRLGGDFDLQRFITDMRTAHRFGGPFELTTRLLLGLGSSALPPQRRFALGGRSTLPAYDFKEFSGGARMVVANLEWRYHLPSPWPTPALVYDAGALWGGPQPGSGLRSDIGLGLRWPSEGRVLIRADVAVALSDRRAAASVRAQGGF